MESQLTDEFGNFKPKVASNFLKVLTILTMIACAWMAFQTISFALNPDAQLLQMEERIAQSEEKGISGFWVDMSYKGLDMMHTRKENLMLFAITDLVGLVLCFFGAWQMRKLQKTGFYSWLVGEFTPWIVSVIIIGNTMFEPMFLTTLIVPIAFTIMYATQLKNMN